MRQTIQSLVQQKSSLTFLLLLMVCLGCKGTSDGPPAPEPEATKTLDSDKKSSSDAIPGAAAPSGSTQTNGLPTQFAKGLADCQKNSLYFDLQLGSCTTLALADFPCDLNILLTDENAVIDADQKKQLKEYVDINMKGFALFACTADASGPTLHFYKIEADKIRANNVKIAKAT